MNTEFGQRLKQARKAAALTQAQLAKKVGIGQSTIAELEKIGSGSSHTPAIAAILNVSCPRYPLQWLQPHAGRAAIGSLSTTHNPQQPPPRRFFCAWVVCSIQQK